MQADFILVCDLGQTTGEASIWRPDTQINVIISINAEANSFPLLSPCGSCLPAFLIPLASSRHSYICSFSFIFSILYLWYFLIIYSSFYGFPVFFLSFFQLEEQSNWQAEWDKWWRERNGRGRGKIKFCVCVCVPTVGWGRGEDGTGIQHFSHVAIYCSLFFFFG